MQKLVDEFSPIIYFSNNEQYFPSSIEYIFENSTLYDQNKPVAIDLTTKNVYDYVLEKYGYNGQRNKNLKLVLTNNTKYGDRFALSCTPIYALVTEKSDRYVIYYIILYPYSGEKNIALIQKVGAHYGDIEHLTVEVTKEKKIIRVFYGAHADINGVWIPAPKLTTIGNHVVAYVAEDSHGLYPNTGFAFRFYGFANDIMRGDIKWVPKVVLLHKMEDPIFNPAVDGWLYFPGDLGEDGTSSVFDKPFFKHGDPETNLKSPPLYGPTASKLFQLFGYSIYPSLIILLTLLGLYQKKISIWLYLLFVFTIVIITIFIVSDKLKNIA